MAAVKAEHVHLRIRGNQLRASGTGDKPASDHVTAGRATVPERIVKLSAMYVPGRTATQSLSRSHVNRGESSRGRKGRRYLVHCSAKTHNVAAASKRKHLVGGGIRDVIDNDGRIHNSWPWAMAHPSDRHLRGNGFRWCDRVDGVEISIAIAQEDSRIRDIEYGRSQHIAGAAGDDCHRPVRGVARKRGSSAPEYRGNFVQLAIVRSDVGHIVIIVNPGRR